MRLATSLLALALCSAVLATSVTVGAVHRTECTVQAPDTTCTFPCSKSHWVAVSAYGERGAAGRVTCNTAFADCRGVPSCFENSVSVAAADDTAVCERLYGDWARCVSHQEIDGGADGGNPYICEATEAAPTCEFLCYAEGSYVSVSGDFREIVQGSADCGPGSAECRGVTSCVGESHMLNLYGVGLCTLASGNRAICVGYGP